MKLFFHFLNGMCLPRSFQKKDTGFFFFFLFQSSSRRSISLRTTEYVCTWWCIGCSKRGKKDAALFHFPHELHLKKIRENQIEYRFSHTRRHSPLNFPPLFSSNQVKKRVLSTLLFSLPFSLSSWTWRGGKWSDEKFLYYKTPFSLDSTPLIHACLGVASETFIREKTVVSIYFFSRHAPQGEPRADGARLRPDRRIRRHREGPAGNNFKL